MLSENHNVLRKDLAQGLGKTVVESFYNINERLLNFIFVVVNNGICQNKQTQRVPVYRTVAYK